MTGPLSSDAAVTASRHPNGKDLRLTAHCGPQVVGVVSLAPDATVGEALAALQRLEQLAMLHRQTA